MGVRTNLWCIFFIHHPMMFHLVGCTRCLRGEVIEYLDVSVFLFLSRYCVQGFRLYSSARLRFVY